MNFRLLCLAILIALPFSRSLVLGVGFPLKIYELLLPLALMAALRERKLMAGHAAPFIWGWVVFWLWSLIPTISGNALLSERHIGELEWATGRYSPGINAIFHSVYLALDILALLLFSAALRSRTLSILDFARGWSIGALLSVAYALLLNFASWLGIPLTLLGRSMEVQSMSVGPLRIIRSGPFEEGNFFGLYLVCSLAIALWALPKSSDRWIRWTVPISILGVLICASPAAIFFSLLLVVGAVSAKTLGKPWRIGSALLSAALIGAVVFTDLLQRLVLDKFSLFIYGGVTDSGNVSLLQRLNESWHAWQIALDYPMGVGIGNFAFFWGEHSELYPWLIAPYTTTKLIPNNVYLEILSEQGWPGLVVFLVLMVMPALALWRSRQLGLLLGFISLLGYFLVYPTFRLVFLWVFWAFLFSVAAAKREEA